MTLEKGKHYGREAAQQALADKGGAAGEEETT